MKKKTILFLLLFLSGINLTPLISVRGQESQWVLIERGENFERYQNAMNPNQYTWHSAPQWVLNPQTEAYAPYVFEDKGTFYEVRTGLIGAEIHRGKAIFYSPDMNRLAVGRETWLVFQRQGDEWNPVCASLLPYYQTSYYKESADFIEITGEWATQKGTLSIVYHFEERLKHTVTWAPNQAGKYALVQFWNNTHYSDVTLGNGTTIRRTQGDAIIGKTDSLTFLFGDDIQPFGVFENQHSASDFLHKTLFAKGTIYYEGIQITDGVAWIFYNSTLCTVNSGETIEIDPDTATIEPPLGDTKIDQYNPDQNYGGDTTIHVNGRNIQANRVYVEFDLSSIPDSAIVQSAYFDIKGYTSSGIDGHTIQCRRVTVDWDESTLNWNNQPALGTLLDSETSHTAFTWENYTVTSSIDSTALTNDWISFSLKHSTEDIGETCYQSYYAKEFEGTTNDPKLRINYISPIPSISSAQITNMDNTDELFPMYRWYDFEVVADDANGADDISKVYLRGKDGANTIFEVRGDSLDSTPAWSIQTGSDIIDLDTASCLWETSGTQGTATFKIRIEYDHPQYLNMELDAYVEDTGAENSGWINAQTDYYDTITNIVTTFNLDDDRGNLSQSVTASGQITFEDSNLYPSNSNFTDVSVYDSSNNNEGTDNTIINGEWEITFNTPETVGLDTYNLYIDIIDDYPDGEETSPTDTFINDRYNVTSFWASNDNPQIGDNITLYAIFESEYDSHICDGDDSITIEDLQFTYDPIEEYFFAEIGKDEEGTYYFDTLNSIYENTYEVYNGNLDYNLSITWGYVQYELYGLFYENGTYSGNVTVNAHFTDSLDSFTLEQYIEKNYENKPTMFSWKLEGGATRRIYIIGANETHYLFTPFEEYAGYSFEIKDYSGVIGFMNSYLESYEIVNGTERLIERALIRDTLNPTSLILQKYLTYRIQIRGGDGTTYCFGYFTPAVDTIPILIIEETQWSDQLHYVGEHITVEFQRPDPEHIRINYKDERTRTTSIFVEILLKNGIQTWNDTSTQNLVQFNWYNAINTTDYLVKLTAQHEDFEEVYASDWLTGLKQETEDIPDFDIIGKGAKQAFGAFLIFAAFMIFSRANALMGTFFATAITYVVMYAGFLPEAYLPVHAVMALTILWGLSRRNV